MPIELFIIGVIVCFVLGIWLGSITRKEPPPSKDTEQDQEIEELLDKVNELMNKRGGE